MEAEAPGWLSVGGKGLVGAVKRFGPVWNPLKRQTVDFVRLVLASVTTCEREFALLVVAGDFDPLACAAYRFFRCCVHFVYLCVTAPSGHRFVQLLLPYPFHFRMSTESFNPR